MDGSPAETPSPLAIEYVYGQPGPEFQDTYNDFLEHKVPLPPIGQLDPEAQQFLSDIQKLSPEIFQNACRFIDHHSRNLEGSLNVDEGIPVFYKSFYALEPFIHNPDALKAIFAADQQIPDDFHELVDALYSLKLEYRFEPNDQSTDETLTKQAAESLIPVLLEHTSKTIVDGSYNPEITKLGLACIAHLTGKLCGKDFSEIPLYDETTLWQKLDTYARTHENEQSFLMLLKPVLDYLRSNSTEPMSQTDNRTDKEYFYQKLGPWLNSVAAEITGSTEQEIMRYQDILHWLVTTQKIKPGFSWIDLGSNDSQRILYPLIHYADDVLECKPDKIIPVDLLEFPQSSDPREERVTTDFTSEEFWRQLPTKLNHPQQPALITMNWSVLQDLRQTEILDFLDLLASNLPENSIVITDIAAGYEREIMQFAQTRPQSNPGYIKKIFPSSEGPVSSTFFISRPGNHLITFAEKGMVLLNPSTANPIPQVPPEYQSNSGQPRRTMVHQLVRHPLPALYPNEAGPV